MDEVRRPGGELTRWEQLYGRAFSGASDGEEDASEKDEQIEAWIQSVQKNSERAAQRAGEALRWSVVRENSPGEGKKLELEDVLRKSMQVKRRPAAPKTSVRESARSLTAKILQDSKRLATQDILSDLYVEDSLGCIEQHNVGMIRSSFQDVPERKSRSSLSRVRARQPREKKKKATPDKPSDSAAHGRRRSNTNGDSRKSAWKLKVAGQTTQYKHKQFAPSSSRSKSVKYRKKPIVADTPPSRKAKPASSTAHRRHGSGRNASKKLKKQPRSHSKLERTPHTQTKTSEDSKQKSIAIGERERKRQSAWDAAESMASRYWDLLTLKRSLGQMRRISEKNKKQRDFAYLQARKARLRRCMRKALGAWVEARTRLKERRMKQVEREARRREEKRRKEVELDSKAQLFSDIRKLETMRKIMKMWCTKATAMREESRMLQARSERRAQMEDQLMNLLSNSREDIKKEESSNEVDAEPVPVVVARDSKIRKQPVKKDSQKLDTCRKNRLTKRFSSHGSSEAATKPKPKQAGSGSGSGSSRDQAGYSKVNLRSSLPARRKHKRNEQPTNKKLARKTRMMISSGSNANANVHASSSTSSIASIISKAKTKQHRNRRNETKIQGKSRPDSSVMPSMGKLILSASTNLSPLKNNRKGAQVVEYPAATMRERAEERRKKREELKRQYSEKMAQRRKEVEMKAKAEEQKRIAQLKAERRKRLQKEDKLKKKKERQQRLKRIAERKWQLACMHNLRSRLIFFGWRPWRCLVERRMASAKKADFLNQFHLKSRAMCFWKTKLQQRRKQRLKEAKRKRLGTLFLAWRRRVADHTKQKEASWTHYCEALVRKNFFVWAKALREKMDMREARMRKQEAVVVSRLQVLKVRRHLSGWRDAMDKKRRYKQLKSQVKGWLSEMQKDVVELDVPHIGIGINVDDDDCVGGSAELELSSSPVYQMSRMSDANNHHEYQHKHKYNHKHKHKLECDGGTGTSRRSSSDTAFDLKNLDEVNLSSLSLSDLGE
mmetsp:Transcript_4908/g.8975  ORF Transcript_4908/g.8975 Transcript_4908/m.8975 type:complete len:1008 (+) Transcript_4908:121-3144(+)|eukprot:CAMPEP_0197524218 /NCGR_PEP_ID=MMETSP1318-20131121/8946_1 /TAXON_ID=552666 /ORGANISM="Partenskyella glossopodia, Strain RCC365" /LENGTH=1007 /DNA_ID=CAMNT_0043077113 /DNA_START=94 /DNA_END=3117 /DNA_ORIENTATION=+